MAVELPKLETTWTPNSTNQNALNNIGTAKLCQSVMLTANNRYKSVTYRKTDNEKYRAGTLWVQCVQMCVLLYTGLLQQTLKHTLNARTCRFTSVCVICRYVALANLYGTNRFMRRKMATSAAVIPMETVVSIRALSWETKHTRPISGIKCAENSHTRRVRMRTAHRVATIIWPVNKWAYRHKH